MKKFLSLLLIVVVLILGGCKDINTNEYSNYSWLSKTTTAYFGTECSLGIYDDFTDARNVAKRDRVWERIRVLLEQIEKAISVAIENSDISRFNQLAYGESITVSDHTANILRIANQVYQDTNGIYDPTVYNLVDLWGLTPRFNSIDYKATTAYDRNKTTKGFTNLPDSKYIEAFTQLTDFSKVQLVGNTLTKTMPSVIVDGVSYNQKLDLGGIGKGYVCDVVRNIMLEEGYKYGYFSCGGSSMAVLQRITRIDGANTVTPWQVGVRKVREDDNYQSSYMKIACSNVSISTSGDYEHSYDYNGIKYCHIIDPKTGYPINTQIVPQHGVASVTLLGDSSAYLDAMTTALCVMGDDAIEYCRDKNLAVSIVKYDENKANFDVFTTFDMEKITEIAPNYAINEVK